MLTASSPEIRFKIFLHLSSPKFLYPEQPRKTPFEEFLITKLCSLHSGHKRSVSIGIPQIVRQNDQDVGTTMLFSESGEGQKKEEDRRAAWADYYAKQGDFEKAKELGWEEKPQWQIHQEQEAAAALASIPSLEDL